MFPEISLNGSAQELGEQHGHLLCTAIEDTLEFYARLFARKEAEIFAMAKHFKRVIADFHAPLLVEMEALAAAAKIHPLWIIALNARSEILNTTATECTALYFQGQALLGQNWDWARDMEARVHLVRLQPEAGPRVLMLTEPGIIGKIGLNEAGLGVCLNILSCAQPARGLPVHLLLRALLGAQTMEQALGWVERAGPGRASNILLADAKGNGVDIEFAVERQFQLPRAKVQVHTNHYLGGPVETGALQQQSSLQRYKKASALLTQSSALDLACMQSVLADDSEAEYSICAPFHPHPSIGSCGTIATLIMDLPQRQMWVKRVAQQGAEFIQYGI